MHFFSAEHTDFKTLPFQYNIWFMCLKKKVIIFYFKRMYSQMRLC